MDYGEQVASNEWTFLELLKKMKPDLWVLNDLINQCHINYLILLKVIYHLNNIATGSKYGDVTIQIQDGVCTFVKGTESSRINENVIVPEPDKE